MAAGRSAGQHLFGLTMIALIWGAVKFHLNTNSSVESGRCIQSTSNLAAYSRSRSSARSRRMIEFCDRCRLSSVNGTLLADFDRRANEIDDWGHLTVQLSLVDADGWLTASTLGLCWRRSDRSDRDYFKVHRRLRRGRSLFSEPIFGRVCANG